jgi:hypothetical protein
MKGPSIKIFFFFISFFVLVGLACGLSTQPDSVDTSPPEMLVEEEPVTVVQEPEVVEEVVEPPAPTDPPMRQIPPTQTPEPVEEITEEPEDEPQAYFTEEFEGDLSGWSYFLMSGDEDKMDLYAENGRLVFDLQGQRQFVYFKYDLYTYTNVKIELLAENLQKNTNSVSLICNYSDRFGWYEFNVSNGGEYEIYAYSELEGGYSDPPLATGGSIHVRIGRDFNTYTAVCQGNQLKLYINGYLTREITDTRYNLKDGQVGFSVSSYNVLPILVEVDYFSISMP